MITTIFVVMLTIGHGGTGEHGENDGHGLDADNGGSVKPVGQAGHRIYGGLMDYGGLTMADIWCMFDFCSPAFSPLCPPTSTAAAAKILIYLSFIFH